MRPARLTLAAPLALALLAAGCASATTDPLRSEADLLAAPTELVVQEQVIPLEAHIWRDFMPSAPPAPRPLAAVVRLPANGPVRSVIRIWVILGEDVWTGAAVAVPGTEDWVARNGPEWPVGSTPQVVAEVQVASQGRRLVRFPSVTIRAVH